MSDESNPTPNDSTQEALTNFQRSVAKKQQRAAEARKQEDQERLKKLREDNKPVPPKGFIEVSVGDDSFFVAVRHIVSIAKTDGNSTLLTCTESVGRLGSTFYAEQSQKEIIKRIDEAQKS